VLPDLDRRIAEDEMQGRHEAEKFEHYKEEVALLEKQFGDNVRNIQR